MSKSEYLIKGILLPLFLLGVGGIMLFGLFSVGLPDINDLTELEGTVESFRAVKSGRSDYNIVIKFIEYNAEFEDIDLKKSEAEELLNSGTKMRFHIEKEELEKINQPTEIRTWSTTINGQTLQSPESRLKRDFIFKNLILPVAALGIISFGIFLFYRERKNNKRKKLNKN